MYGEKQDNIDALTEKAEVVLLFCRQKCYAERAKTHAGIPERKCNKKLETGFATENVSFIV